MTAIFFYGLFMDQSLLVDKGMHPRVVGPAVLHDYRIHIGERATLVSSPAARAYGIVMQLAGSEAQELYSEPSVKEYVEESVRVEMLDTGEAVEASCYNLPASQGLAGTNAHYAVQLSQLATSLQFDATYVAEIAAFGHPA